MERLSLHEKYTPRNKRLNKFIIATIWKQTCKNLMPTSRGGEEAKLSVTTFDVVGGFGVLGAEEKLLGTIMFHDLT